jgi:ribosomal protein L11 methylase PrmA
LDVLAHVVLPTMLERTATGFAGTSDLEVTKQAQFPKASYRKMLVKLKRWISALEPKGIKKTTWSDYASNHSYDDNEVRSKSAFVEDFTKSCQPGIVWDIGCNTGDYSKIALDAGAKLAIGFEYDSGALELAFRRAREQNLNFLPLYLDAANPSPNQGWNQTERLGFSGRRSADSVIALAVVHHLAIGRNIPLPDVVNWIVGCAPQGVIEFIPKSDPMIIRMLQNREDIFADYDEANFEYALTSRAQVIKTETISASGRKMYWYNR